MLLSVDRFLTYVPWAENSAFAERVDPLLREIKTLSIIFSSPREDNILTDIFEKFFDK